MEQCSGGNTDDLYIQEHIMMQMQERIGVTMQKIKKLILKTLIMVVLLINMLIAQCMV